MMTTNQMVYSQLMIQVPHAVIFLKKNIHNTLEILGFLTNSVKFHWPSVRLFYVCVSIS